MRINELKEKADINYINSYNNSALSYACIYGHLEIVKYLLLSPELKENSNINEIDIWGRNILFQACESKNLELVKYLLLNKELSFTPDLNLKNIKGHNILIHNCEVDNMEIVEFLIMDMNIKIDEETLCYLSNNKSKNECCNRALNLVKVKELKNNLENSLTLNTNHKLKHKI